MKKIKVFYSFMVGLCITSTFCPPVPKKKKKLTNIIDQTTNQALHYSIQVIRYLPSAAVVINNCAYGVSEGVWRTHD